MIINCRAEQPQQLKFLEVTRGWRWLNAVIELCEVKLQKEIGPKVKLTAVKMVVSDSPRARNFARFLSKLWDLPLLEELPKAGPVTFVTENRELRVQFQANPQAPPVGPVIYVTSFAGESRG
jgi:uncharacterized protein YhjY with autotransporter beta-barrel domain